MTLVGVASPKGGVAKTTLAVNLAALVAQHAPDYDVAVIDADENRSAEEWIETGGDDFPVRVSTLTVGESTRVLRRLRNADLPLAFIDLPGARRGGELRALLTGTSGEPVVDFLIVPTQNTRGDAAVVTKSVTQEIAPTGIPYAVVFTRVPSYEAAEVGEQIETLNRAGVTTCRTVVREYRAWKDANNAGLPLMRIGGRDDRARLAEDDLRSLAREVFPMAGLTVPIPDTDRSPRRRLVALTTSSPAADSPKEGRTDG